MYSAFIFGIICMFCYGIGNGIAKIPLNSIGSKKTLFFRNLITSTFLFISVLIFWKDTSFKPYYIFIAFLISFLGYIPIALFYHALKNGKIGIVTPIANSSIVYILILSIVFADEKIGLVHIISIIIIYLGIMLISIDFSQIKSSDLFTKKSGIWLAIITSVLWGIVFFLFMIPARELGAALTSFIIEFGIFVIAWVALMRTKEKIEIPDKKTVGLLLALGLFAAIGIFVYNLGVSISEISIVASLTFANPLVASVYGFTAYNERLKKQQYIACILIIAGIVCLYYLT